MTGAKMGNGLTMALVMAVCWCGFAPPMDELAAKIRSNQGDQMSYRYQWDRALEGRAQLAQASAAAERSADQNRQRVKNYVEEQRQKGREVGIVEEIAVTVCTVQ